MSGRAQVIAACRRCIASCVGEVCAEAAAEVRGAAPPRGPLDALLERLERLELAARERARKRRTVAGLGADLGEAAAYRNAAAMVADVLRGGR